MEQAKRCATQIRPTCKVVKGGIFGRPEDAADVISTVAVDYVDVDLRVKSGDYALNSGRIIRIFVRPRPFHALLCSIAEVGVGDGAILSLTRGFVLAPY